MRGKTADWLVLDEHSEVFDAEVAGVIETVARRVHGKYERFADLADLTQEARIMAISKHEDCITARDYGYLSFRLERDMMDHCEMAFHVARNNAAGESTRPGHSAITQQGVTTFNEEGEKVYTAVSSSYDAAIEDANEERIDLYPEAVPGGYTEDAIKTLLPAVWDESYAYGLPSREDAPEEGMPRASGNKAHGSTHWAYIADIKTGWEKTSLTLLERRSLLMAFGLGWTHDTIAAEESVTRQAITKRIDTAVKKIAAQLNGA